MSEKPACGLPNHCGCPEGLDTLAGLGGSPAKRNLHLAALRGFFDRLVQRHVVVLNPAASVKGVKELVVEGKTPKIGIEQARTLLASINTGHVVGLRVRAILASSIPRSDEMRARSISSRDEISASW